MISFDKQLHVILGLPSTRHLLDYIIDYQYQFISNIDSLDHVLSLNETTRNICQQMGIVIPEIKIWYNKYLVVNCLDSLDPNASVQYHQSIDRWLRGIITTVVYTHNPVFMSQVDSDYCWVAKNNKLVKVKEFADNIADFLNQYSLGTLYMSGIFYEEN